MFRQNNIRDACKPFQLLSSNSCITGVVCVASELTASATEPIEEPAPDAAAAAPKPAPAETSAAATAAAAREASSKQQEGTQQH